jgi:hypothetical protein
MLYTTGDSAAIALFTLELLCCGHAYQQQQLAGRLTAADTLLS